jgi:hypothetical protein
MSPVRFERAALCVCVVKWPCLLWDGDGSAYASVAADASDSAGTADAEYADDA